MFSNTKIAITQGIKVSVRTTFIPEQSNPEAGRFMFAYQVKIKNESPFPVKLLRRMWKITDAHGRKRIVDGEGVIGQQPLLNPGQAHQYISGCDFPTPLGKMEGHYVMQKENGEEFKVKIPAFILANIAVLN